MMQLESGNRDASVMMGGNRTAGFITQRSSKWKRVESEKSSGRCHVMISESRWPSIRKLNVSIIKAMSIGKLKKEVKPKIGIIIKILHHSSAFLLKLLQAYVKFNGLG